MAPKGKGINIGVTVITAAILVPIATGDIGLKDLLDAFKITYGLGAIFCGGLDLLYCRLKALA